MEKVYLVYYDNGQSYEDHDVSVSKIFANIEGANKYAEESNAPLKGPFVCSISKEDYYKQDADDIMYIYEQFYQMELFDWNWVALSDSRYFVCEADVHP